MKSQGMIGTRLAVIIGTLLLLPLAAQVPQPSTRYVRVSFSSQDKMGQALTGLNFTGYSTTACSVDGQGIQIGGGLIWQAAEGLTLHLVAPHVAALASTQARAKSKWQVMSILGAELMFDFAIIMGADIIHANPAKLAGKVLRVAPIILNKKLADWNAQQALIHPDPLTTFAGDALDPAAVISIPSGAGVCVQRLFLANAGGPQGGSVDVAVMVSPQPVMQPIVFAPVLTLPPGTSK
jgi:hypothetical protein